VSLVVIKVYPGGDVRRSVIAAPLGAVSFSISGAPVYATFVPFAERGTNNAPSQAYVQ
jgi:hypothetical protein